MNLKLLSPNNPLLNAKSNLINLDALRKGNYNELIDSMFAFAKGEQSNQNKKIMVGLSAIQVGFPVSLILIDLAANGKGKTGDLQEFINPTIEFASEETNELYEACFSAGELAGIVASPNIIRFSAYNRNGLLIHMEVSGYTARIVRHEVEHTEGKRFPDRITDLQKLHIVSAGDWPEYRNGEAWRNWAKPAPAGAWEKIKQGKNV